MVSTADIETRRASRGWPAGLVNQQATSKRQRQHRCVADARRGLGRDDIDRVGSTWEQKLLGGGVTGNVAVSPLRKQLHAVSVQQQQGSVA